MQWKSSKDDLVHFNLGRANLSNVLRPVFKQVSPSLIELLLFLRSRGCLKRLSLFR